MKLFDTHAHLSDPAFDADRDELISTFIDNNIALAIDVACDLREAERTVSLIERYPFIYATAGMHPHHAAIMDDVYMEMLKNYLKHEKVMALGEIGLDYHYDFAPRETQIKWFCEQLDLAIELNIPVTLHIREAFGDAMDILRARRGRFTGEMHCFSGSVELMRECVNMGLYIALGGAVTFKNASRILDVAKEVPMERLLLETDCPYMTPVPFRSTRNDPTKMHLSAEKIAELKGVDVVEVADVTYKNGCELFGITGV